MNLLILLSGALFVILIVPYGLYSTLTFFARPLQPDGSMNDDEPLVSVVLPTFNEERIIERKLEELCSIDYPDERLEIVVVDASTDSTPGRVRRFASEREFPRIRVIRESDRRGLAPALNDGYEAADGEIIVKTDCDSEIASDSIRRAVAWFSDPEIGAVTGRSVETIGGSQVETSYRSVQERLQIMESWLDSTFIFHGPYSAFRKANIVALDPNSLADDTELALKIRRQGKRVVFDPGIEYKEASHSSFRKRRKQKDRRGVGLIRLLFQHLDAFGKYGRYGRIVLPFNFWFMVVSPWLLLATVLAAIGAVVLSVGLVGFLSLLPIIGFVWLGQRDSLWKLQPVYAVFDTQVSLLIASVTLLRSDSDGTWEIDSDLRELYEE